MGLVNKCHSLIGNLALKHHLEQILIGYVFQRLSEIPAEQQKTWCYLHSKIYSRHSRTSNQWI